MKRSIPVIAALAVMAGTATAVAQQDTPEVIMLSVRETDHNDVTIVRDGNSWTITTTGENPWVYLDAETPALGDTHTVLGFESFNASFLIPLEINAGDMAPAFLLKDGKYELPRTEGWSYNIYDLSRTWWGLHPEYRWVRVRFGYQAGNTFTLRNINLSKLSDRDRARFENADLNEKLDRELAERLNGYFDKDFTGEITSVSASYPGGSVTIKGNCPEKRAMLVEIPMWEDATSFTAPATAIDLRKGDFSFTLDRWDGNRDRLLSGWAVARQDKKGKWELLSAQRYVEDIEAANGLPKAVSKSVKGLGGCPFDHEDMQILGIGYANFNIILDQILFTDDAPGREPFTYAGQTWYADVNGPAMKLIDRDVKISEQKGWVISAILLIPVNRGAPAGSWLDRVAHPEVEPSAAFSMPDMLDRDAVEAYAAAMDFLARRYSGGEHGRIHSWTVHNEIQNGFFWTNAGHKRIETYMNLYQKSMRLVQSIARQYDPHAQAYISLDHDWNRLGNPRSYKGLEQMELLSKFCAREGDFEWGIAFHPYPQDINNPRTWEDDQALYSFDTPYITPRNLEVMNAWVDRPEVSYRGRGREIHLTEQGLNSPDYSEKSLLDQAAGMAYCFKKMEPLEHILGYYYHLWSDAYEEGGLKLGLRKYWDAEGDPRGYKPIYDVVRDYATPQWETTGESLKAVIGIGDWSEIQYKGDIK